MKDAIFSSADFAFIYIESPLIIELVASCKTIKSSPVPTRISLLSTTDRCPVKEVIGAARDIPLA